MVIYTVDQGLVKVKDEGKFFVSVFLSSLKIFYLFCDFAFSWLFQLPEIVKDAELLCKVLLKLPKSKV